MGCAHALSLREPPLRCPLSISRCLAERHPSEPPAQRGEQLNRRGMSHGVRRGISLVTACGGRPAGQAPVEANGFLLHSE
ncbi:unnamed protein product [Lampetra planeri]